MVQYGVSNPWGIITNVPEQFPAPLLEGEALEVVVVVEVIKSEAVSQRDCQWRCLGS